MLVNGCIVMVPDGPLCKKHYMVLTCYPKLTLSEFKEKLKNVSVFRKGVQMSENRAEDVMSTSSSVAATAGLDDTGDHDLDESKVRSHQKNEIRIEAPSIIYSLGEFLVEFGFEPASLNVPVTRVMNECNELEEVAMLRDDTKKRTAHVYTDIFYHLSKHAMECHLCKGQAADTFDHKASTAASWRGQAGTARGRVATYSVKDVTTMATAFNQERRDRESMLEVNAVNPLLQAAPQSTGLPAWASRLAEAAATGSRGGGGGGRGTGGPGRGRGGGSSGGRSAGAGASLGLSRSAPGGPQYRPAPMPCARALAVAAAAEAAPAAGQQARTASSAGAAAADDDWSEDAVLDMSGRATVNSSRRESAKGSVVSAGGRPTPSVAGSVSAKPVLHLLSVSQKTPSGLYFAHLSDHVSMVGS
jgi:hypothetical protein